MKRLPLVLIVSCCVSLAHAQDEGKASREREALRRAQNALRAATDQQSQLQADKAALTQDKDKLAEQLKAEQGRGQAASAKLRGAEQRAEALQAELDAANKARQQHEAAAQQREQELTLQLQAARREGAEHLQTARTLTTLLERSTTELAGAEDKNRQLYAIGQQLVQRYLGRKPDEIPGIADPVLGLTAIKLENYAEEMRAQLAAQRVR